MSVIRKKQEEKNLKILRELLTFESNRYCFDCNQRGPTYVNITIGSFVCTNCGGALRKYSHRLKSISMSNFSQTEMDFIRKRGNNICKKIYYGLCEQNIPPEMDIKNGLLDSHLRAKYELKKWYLEPSAELEEETTSQNQVIFDRVERGVPKPVKSYTMNSSSNIIIEPPKSTTNKLASTKGSKVSLDLVENMSPFETTSQPKSSNVITNAIDPSKLGGGSAVKLPMPGDSKNSAWLSSTADKPNQNTQSPFGDDFLFSSAKEKSPISKSQTMNFSMPPLVPMTQGTLHDGVPQVPQHHGDMKGSDKYAALAELDDLFSSTSVSKHATGHTTFAPSWDTAAASAAVSPANNFGWYGSSPYNAAPTPVMATHNPNPFSTTTTTNTNQYQATAIFNPFTVGTHTNNDIHHEHMQWPGATVAQAPANPFLHSAATVNSKNPFL